MRKSYIAVAAAAIGCLPFLSAPAHAASVAVAATGQMAPPPYAVAAASPDWVRTPFGLYYTSCLYTVPTGDNVDVDGNIVTPTGVQTVPDCPYSGPAKPPAATTSSTSTPPPGPPPEGWWADSWWNHSKLGGIEAIWTVPSNPGATGALLYMFPSIQDNPVTAIVQPVLQWGVGPNGGGSNIWVMDSWYVWNNGNSYVAGSPVHVFPNHTIKGVVSMSGCNSSGGNCSVGITTTDLTTGISVNLGVHSASTWGNAQGGVLEEYGLTSCSQLPGSGSVKFTGIKVYNLTGQQYTSVFAPEDRVTSCSTSAAATNSTTMTTWTP